MASTTSRTFPILGLAWPLLVLGLMAAFDVTISPANPKLTHIPGRLTYDKPVSHSSIALVPSGQPDAVLATLCPVWADGSFTLAPYDAPLEPGRYDIFIILEEYDLRWHKQGGYEAMGAQTAGPAPRATAASLRQQRIPTRFMTPGTSGLWITIERESRGIKCYNIALRD
jgi:hypothetical protein